MRSDRQLQTEVMDELAYEPSLSAEKIGVSVNDGVVTLSGFVPSYAEKYSAERAAFRVAGVKAVAEEIQVSLPGSSIKTDAEIARAALDALAWNVNVPASVRVAVEGGRVILRGEVEWAFQRDAATDAIRTLTGVIGITNHLAIRPRVQSTDVKSRIEQALLRRAETDCQKVRVETEGSRVILSGEVSSNAERQDATAAAWSAPGVTDVQCQLKII